MLLFGACSPVIVDIEETLLRLDQQISAAVSVSGIPESLITENIIELAFSSQTSERSLSRSHSHQFVVNNWCELQSAWVLYCRSQ